LLARRAVRRFCFLLGTRPGEHGAYHAAKMAT
jgi:hypothetical protein